MTCVLFLAAASCDWWSPGIEGPANPQLVASDLPRDTDPQVPGQQVVDLVRGNSEFAFDLLQEVSADAENVFFSPYSISLALAMTYAGARGATETEMGDVLHFEPTGQGIHPVFNWLDLQLDERDQIAPPSEGEGFELRIANAVWGQEGYGFLEDYLDTLAVNYGAGLRLTDFMGDPESSRIAINDWASEETEGKVEDLLPPSTINVETRLVLTNAIYFVAPWRKPFDEAETRDEPFTTLAGASATVAMMQQIETFPYARFDIGQAVELAYNGEQIAMVLLIPDEGQYETFEADLDFDRYEEIVAALQEQSVDLGMPRFGFSCDVALPNHLQSLGMTDAFVPGTADFSGMDGSRDLFISDVRHKAFVTVDEAGTEAAAATAVVISPTAEPGTPITLTIDRPFVFVIRDMPTGTILFAGRVVGL
jgi:serpin B